MKRAHRYSICGWTLVQRMARWSALLALPLFLNAAFGAQAPESPPKRVLLISTGSRLAPGFVMVDQQIVQVLGTIASTRVEIYPENLDIVRFPAEGAHRIFSDYLSAKYQTYPPDLVVLLFIGNLGITGKVLVDLFPDTPIIVAGFTEEEIRPDQFGRHVSGVAHRVNPDATLKLMRRLQPDLRRVVVVGGTAEVDRQILDRVRSAAQTFPDLDFEYWDNRPMREIRRGVAALPPQTAVLFTRTFRDVTGQSFVSAEVGKWIGQSANAPVYLLLDPSLGTGAVGGAVASAEAFGKRAGELARRVLTGTPPEALPFEVSTATVTVFDWRALKRWGISESLLPPDSVVRFKPQSIWDQYRWYLVGALAVIVLQSAMIVTLVVQRRQRRRVQSALRDSQQLMELAADAGELGLWSRNLTDDGVWANGPMRSLFGFGENEVVRFDDVIRRIHPDDRAHVLATGARTQVATLPAEGEFRTRLPDGSERWVLARGRSMNGLDGRESRRMGVVLDITERKRAEQQLRDSEENLRRLVESTRVVIWQADYDSWVFTYVSPYAVEFLGYALERWYEKDFWISHIHPDDRARAVGTCETMSKTARDFAFEYRMIKASGEFVWIHDIVNGQDDGKSRHLRGLMFDITERKHSEQALRESEDRFRAMANSAPVMIWMSGTDKLCTFFNNGWLEFTGRTLKQELGDGWTEGVHQEDLDRCLDVYVTAFDARQEFKVEYRLRRRDGEYRYVVDHGVPRFERDGTFLGYIGTVLDVTEGKRAEESLDQQRAFLRQVIDVDPNFIFAKDGEGRFTLANKAVADAYGMSVDDLIGKTDADVNANAEEVEFFRRIDLEVMNTRQERFIAEEHITDAQGKTRWLQTVKRPIIGRDGAATQVLGSSTDITLRKKTEMELQKHRAELAHVARISLMGELAASLSHELNQPLTAILSNAQAAQRFMAREPRNVEEVCESLVDIADSTKRAAEVIRRMRVLVKKEEAPAFSTIDLPNVILEVVALVHNDALLQNVRIFLHLDEHLAPIRGDRVQLQQVLLNILLNAFDVIKECPPDKREIEVRAQYHEDGDMNRVAVSDCGPGLQDDTLEKIFQPFFTTKRDGLGMGLSICRSIIEAHGGSLWAENNPDGGATFYFTVPAESTKTSPSKAVKKM